MSGVVFEVVSKDREGRSKPPEQAGSSFEEAFPLAGPILEEPSRVLRGRCSSCSRKLRVRVEGKGPVRVRCPICGHARRIDV